jgi:hypothetical protein
MDMTSISRGKGPLIYDCGKGGMCARQSAPMRFCAPVHREQKAATRKKCPASQRLESVKKVLALSQAVESEGKSAKLQKLR